MKLFRSLLRYFFVFLMMVLLLTACAAPPEVVHFFEGYEWEMLVALFFVALFGLFPAFNIFQWLKAKLGIEDRGAYYMVLVVSILLTVLAMWVTDSLGLEGFDFTLKNIIAYGGVLFAASQTAYQKFKNPKTE